MVPARGPGVGGGGNTHRIPPSWGPAHDHNYSFRTWVQDLQLWLLITELTPQQQAAAIVIHLRGAAREYARTFTTEELTNGGVRNGIQQDPISFVVSGPQERFAQLEDESRLAAMFPFQPCVRRRCETINELLSSFR